MRAELPLLPNEPRVRDASRQQALTEEYLLPACRALYALFRELRARLDPQLAARQPMKWGKPYPLGQCLEISLAIQSALRTMHPATLPESARLGHESLAAFLRHGGQMHQVWGDLRGEYFQNAFLAGTLYIDTANDTVSASKPPVEILPIAEAHLVPIEDYLHFARIAGRYWRARLYPNHLLPELAPYYPVIAVIPGGGIRLEADSAYMVLQAQRQGFRASQSLLAAPPLAAKWFEPLRQALGAAHGLTIATHSSAGRSAALQHCQILARAGVTLTDAQRKVLGAAIATVNRCWSVVSGQAEDERPSLFSGRGS